MSRATLDCMRGAILATWVAVLALGCGGDGGPTGPNSGRVTIKGSFEGAVAARSGVRRWLARLLMPRVPTAHAAVQQEISKVIAVYLNGGFESANVVGGAFEIDVERGAPAGLIFVDASDRPVGYLSLGNGIETLPLTKVRDDVTEIDLQTLFATGAVIQPQHNPLGDELPLSDQEIAALARANAYFASVVKNSDADGDGAIDFLQGSFFRIGVFYFVDAGSFGTALSPTLAQPVSMNCHRVVLYAYDANLPPSVSFSGPTGSALAGTPSESVLSFEGSAIYEAPCLASPELAPAGDYTVSYQGTTLTFSMPDQSSVPSQIVLPMPTLTLAGPDVEQVTWIYRLPTATALLDPLAVMDGIIVQMDGSFGRVYDSPNLPPTTTEHSVTGSVVWSDLTRLYMAYNDVYGNHNVVQWEK